MTQKEKAESLVDHYLGTIIFNIKQNVEADCINVAKQCALILVDEIIEFGNGLGVREPMMYWVGVKQEIKKLV
jgi:hypothetical protein